MNAFFRQTKTKVDRGMQRMVENVSLVNEDFKGEGSTPNKAELYYELRNGQVSVAYPIFVDGQEINRSGYVKEVDRRSELAKLITGSEYMPKVMVNRMWGPSSVMALPSQSTISDHIIHRHILNCWIT